MCASAFKSRRTNCSDPFVDEIEKNSMEMEINNIKNSRSDNFYGHFEDRRNLIKGGFGVINST